MWKNLKDKRPLDYRIVPLWVKTTVGKKQLYGYRKNGIWYHIDHNPMTWKVLKWFDVPEPEEK